MKNLKQVVGVLALLCSSTGMASTVTLTPSIATPLAGTTFDVIVSVDGSFPTTGGATLGLTYNSSRVSVASVAFITPAMTFSVWTVGTTAGTTDLISVTNTTPVPGPFDAFKITFNALTAGAANIVLYDGGDLGWALPDETLALGVVYNNPAVTVQAAVIPLPASVWLLATAVGVVGARAAKRRRS